MINTETIHEEIKEIVEEMATKKSNYEKKFGIIMKPRNKREEDMERVKQELINILKA